MKIEEIKEKILKILEERDLPQEEAEEKFGRNEAQEALWQLKREEKIVSQYTPSLNSDTDNSLWIPIAHSFTGWEEEE